MTRYPISRFCPQCGGKDYTKRKPKQFVAFASDHVCTSCLTRYSPPTPPWAGVVLVLSVCALFVGGAFLIALLFNPCSILGLACLAALGIFTLRLFIGVLRHLIHSARDTGPLPRETGQ